MEGNQMKMREALDMVLRYLQWLYAQGCTDRDRLSDEIDRVVSAIGEPPRNCDVGTAEEQAKRWEQFCIEHHEPWKPGVPAIIPKICKCPCFSMNQCNMFIWAQMPYEGKGESNE